MTENTILDPRIALLRKAADHMRQGDFEVVVPTEGDDELARLGNCLKSLGTELKQQFALLRDLSDLTARVNAGRTLDDVLNHVYEGFHPHIPYDRIGFAVLDEEGEVLRSRWVRSEAPEIVMDARYSAPIRGSSLEEMVRTGQPRIINDLESYLEEHPDSRSTKMIVREGMRSSLTCPLIAEGRPVGVMFFSSMQPGTYDHAHIEVFQLVAGQLAGIVEKARLYQQLLELMEEKNRFLGIAAHDLRNPISTVSGYADVLQRKIKTGDHRRIMEICERVSRVSKRMLTLVEDLLDVSAIESGKLQLKRAPTDIRKVVDEARIVNELTANAKGIRIESEASEDLRRVDADPERISQVLDNLISNAVKYSHAGATVRLRAENVEEGVKVQVIDNGLGIAEEEIPLLFREFSRISSTPTAGERSTGLGLALVKKIIDLHGGRVWVESVKGEGSKFAFVLPADGM